jgi:hypothetical protein
MAEIWKPIPGYEGKYEASSLGRIKSVPRKHQLKEIIMTLDDHNSGYKVVKLRGLLGYKKCFVHRLVAKAFIPNPMNKEIVNHKDLNRWNNTLNNLEWLTQSENVRHGYENRRSIPSPVIINQSVPADDIDPESIPW